MSLLKKVVKYAKEHMEETQLWMLPYSTLMLTLVVLFIMFYAFSSSQSRENENALSDRASTNPDNPQGKQMQQEIALAKNIRDFIQQNRMTDKIQLITTPHAIRIKIESFALFDSGSSELKKDILFFLEHLNDQLKPMTNRVITEGHTDTVSIQTQQDNTNWELSSARSFSVIYFFINKGIAPERLVAQFRPAYTSETETEQARNRRIEIIVIRGAKG
jgi:chemotaxis protein MotB